MKWNTRTQFRISNIPKNLNKEQHPLAQPNSHHRTHLNQFTLRTEHTIVSRILTNYDTELIEN